MNWFDDAQCEGTDSTVFFNVNYKKEQQAKAICRLCDVIDKCLEFAIDTKQPFGVWGGMTPAERRRLRRVEQVMSIRDFAFLVSSQYTGGLVERSQVYYWCSRGMPFHETLDGKMIEPTEALAWLIKEEYIESNTVAV